MPSSWHYTQPLRGKGEQREVNAAFIYEMGIVTRIKNNNAYSFMWDKNDNAKQRAELWLHAVKKDAASSVHG